MYLGIIVSQYPPLRQVFNDVKRKREGRQVCRLPSKPRFAGRGRMRPPLGEPRAYAALLGPLLSVVLASMDFAVPALASPTVTLICLGLASAFLGRLIFNTPLS